MSVPTIKRSDPTYLYIFSLLSWIAKPPFNSLNSHSAGSTTGNCAARSCQSVRFQRNMVLEGENRLFHKRAAFSECIEAAAGPLQDCQRDLWARPCVHAGDFKICAVQMATERLWICFAVHLSPAQYQSWILKSRRRPLIKAFNSRQYTSLANVLQGAKVFFQRT